MSAPSIVAIPGIVGKYETETSAGFSLLADRARRATAISSTTSAGPEPRRSRGRRRCSSDDADRDAGQAGEVGLPVEVVEQYLVGTLIRIALAIAGNGDDASRDHCEDGPSKSVHGFSLEDAGK